MTSDSSPGAAYPADLLPQHLELVKGSAISPEVAQARGYRSVKTRKELVEVGFQPRQGNVPALLIPICDVDCKATGPFLRPDTPRKKGERKINYEWPKGKPYRLDVPQSSQPALSNPAVMLWITDGPRQADALASIGMASIATLGDTGWRHFRLPRNPLADWDRIELQGRTVAIAWGSKALATPEGELELRQFTVFLQSRGAVVKYAIPSPKPDGSHLGVDDVLAAGRNPESLLTDPPSDLPLVPSAGGVESDHPYLATEKGFFLETLVGDDIYLKALTRNWTARIVADILIDDGLEQRRVFEIEATLLGVNKRFRLSPTVFDPMGWITEQLGTSGVVIPGNLVRDHIRAAIQLHSGPVPTCIEHSHTGWARHEGCWRFLHADGSIGGQKSGLAADSGAQRPGCNTNDPNDLDRPGPVGPVSGNNRQPLRAVLPGELSLFSLPNPPDDPDVVATLVHKVLLVLDAAEDTIAYPLLGLVFRSLIGPVAFAVQLVGPTGVFKTSYATVFQQFVGRGLDAEHLVGHFAGTANSLEALAFYLKDMMLLIDDFAPTGSRSDIQKSHRDAERLVRAKGNFGGRSRCRPDGTFRSARSPRANLLITGEDVPEGHSLRARILVIDVQKGDIDNGRLALSQRFASSGELARCTSAFLKWAAPRYDAILAELEADRERWKNEAVPETVYRRTYQAVRELEFGFDLFLQFACDFKALNRKRHEELVDGCWAALEKLAFRQTEYQSCSDPIEQFQYCLSALFASKRAHVANASDGGRPLTDPEAWGYRRKQIPVESEDGQPKDGKVEMKDIWVPYGAKIGWVDFPYLYLIPDIMYAEVQSLAQRLGTPIPLTLQTLGKRLADREVIFRDEERNRIRIRVTIEGAREYVFKAFIHKLRWLNSFGRDSEQIEDDDDLLQMDA